MKTTKKNVTKNLLERFSCSIVKRGKKISGHKILLKSLFILRDKKNKDLRNLPSLSLQKNLTKVKQSIFSISAAQKTEKKPSSPLSKQKDKGGVESGLFSIMPNKKHRLKDVVGSHASAKLLHEKTTTLNQQSQFQFSAQNCFNLSIKPNNEKQANIEQKKLTRGATRVKRALLPSPSLWYGMVSQSGMVLCNKTKVKQNHKNQSKQSSYKDKEITTLIENNNQICQRCVENVKVVLETRKVRKGRVTHKVPIIANSRRQEGKSVALLIKNGSDNFLSQTGKNNDFKELVSESLLSFSQKVMKNSTLPLSKLSWFSDSFFYCQEKNLFYPIEQGLAEELLNSTNLKGASIEKKTQFHSLALQNRGSLHFRWW